MVPCAPNLIALRRVSSDVERAYVATRFPLSTRSNPCFSRRLSVLCLQQSSGNSPGPEVDVAPSFLAHRLLDRDVGDLDPPARLKTR